MQEQKISMLPEVFSKNLKLNLGCGNKKKTGYINIDSSSHCNPDLLLDLKNIPYPFKDCSVREIIMKSVFEHLPADPEIFFGIIQEIYRICQHKAVIHVECPHPTHRWQIIDFTHQKAIHPEGLRLLSKKACTKDISKNSTSSPLAFMYDVDFEMKEYSCEIDPKCISHIENLFGSFDRSKLESYAYLLKDVASKQKFKLIAIKE
ncbi:hypothetical protein [Synechococcus sp. CC9616]|uniref:class I SAM-dependent methyltransferase n=1 Tax=Synechococcus sp. CC9616 TaxID=110663 RepID=UPI0012EB9029|nr:hypothetical protein [Synechococcus sp. CC9616]